jgi:SAM-dependent methyltransferase
MDTEIIHCEIDSASIPGAVMEHDPIRYVERASIRAYVKEWSHLLVGRVLDFGCGIQPYRSYASGDLTTYQPFDKSHYSSETQYDEAIARLQTSTPPFDVVLCTQVLEYYRNPLIAITLFKRILTPGGNLVCTYPTNWDEVEAEDLQRLTMCGMHDLLSACGFEILNHTRRAEVKIGNFRFPLGYGVVARKPTYKV